MCEEKIGSLVMPSRSGLSLLEVLVATTLLLAMAGTATLGYGAMLSQWRLNAATRQVVMDLKVARARSIAEAVNHRVQFPVPGRAYQHQRREGGRQYVDVRPPTALPSGARTIDCTAVGSSITFRPRGNASTFGTITLQNPEGDERKIIIDIAGRMRVE